jgi:spore coat polysaccharide biosynthesis protein SpsF
MSLVIPVIQARAGGTRFPGKVLSPIDGMTMLSRVIAAAREAFPAVEPMIATGHLTPVPAEFGHVVVGDEHDVLLRFVTLAQFMGDDTILVRLTADDPHKLPALIRLAVRVVELGSPYADTNHGQVEGLGAEAFTVACLREADALTPQSEREHVTPWMRRIYGKPISLTVDHPEDLARVGALWR